MKSSNNKCFRKKKEGKEKNLINLGALMGYIVLLVETTISMLMLEVLLEIIMNKLRATLLTTKIKTKLLADRERKNQTLKLEVRHTIILLLVM